jgi:hypothetical protein
MGSTAYLAIGALLCLFALTLSTFVRIVVGRTELYDDFGFVRAQVAERLRRLTIACGIQMFILITAVLLLSSYAQDQSFLETAHATTGQDRAE